VNQSRGSLISLMMWRYFLIASEDNDNYEYDSDDDDDCDDYDDDDDCDYNVLYNIHHKYHFYHTL